ncbi:MULTISPECIES: pyridoxine/pyridoxal/pyridoxamine kinase [Achromobacter]|uniref:pyridoxine/pyridoxal/pyridoxamine kinase n=1 Tax=Achromobacter TaxID=222 RepID=UPI0006FD14AC|nr:MULTISPECIES: pyridoxine/pyridoxal/pyridoxamine kinase [Achromobacter]KRB11809.1 pyridoxal kinase [Achromobacter sp. Root170]MDH1521263.1 pyridoxine/pyridoxal/pyridoxamine kinase [Achromobacter mucicolens]TQJ97147.1 pyridoxal kinase [Achromobacter sp. SLBN-14]
MTAIPAAPMQGAALPARTAQVDVVSIQSQVVYGYVGNNAAMPVFRKAGLRAIALPTVILSNTPHYPTLHGGAVPLDWFEGLLQGLVERRVSQVARAVVCGYLGQPGQAGLLARWLSAVRASRPELRVFIDPVMGDRNDGLYVDEGLVAQYRDLLVPLAEGMTPNHFELELLVGRTLSSVDEVVTAARELIARGPQWIVATSAAPMTAAPGTLQLVVVTQDDVTVVTHPEIAIPPSVHGTGDVFMAGVSSRLLNGLTLVQAVREAAAQVTVTLQRTRELGWEELAAEG